MRNVECKARDPDPAATERACRALGAQAGGTLVQRDTYFATATGRLKLREQTPGGATLIAYDRPDTAAPRESRYRIVEVAQPSALRAALEATIGVRVVVDKHRRLWLWQSVRIHLDEVTGLGHYVELEAVAAHDSDLAGDARLVAGLRERLGISDERLVAVGYAELLEHGLGHGTQDR